MKVEMAKRTEIEMCTDSEAGFSSAILLLNCPEYPGVSHG